MLQLKTVGPMSEKHKASVDSAEIYKILRNRNADWEAIFREAEDEDEAGNCLFYSPKKGLKEMENKWWMKRYLPANKKSVIRVTLGCCCCATTYLH